MKTMFLIITGLCVFILFTIGTSESFAIPVMSNLPPDLGTFSHFFDTGITTTNTHIKEISLNWDGTKKGPTGKIVFDDILNERVTIHIPKDRPRLTNLDFGTSLYALQTDGAWSHIKEIESQCHYILEIQVINSDSIEIETVSVATGRWELVSILDQSCDEYSLKQQVENNMTPQEIECSNNKHVLSERTNGKLACVYPETAKYLNWDIYTNIVLNTSSKGYISSCCVFDDLQKVLDHCENGGEDIFMESDNGTHYINNGNCEWRKMHLHGIADDKKEQILKTPFCTIDMIEFLDKHSSMFDNTKPYSSPLDGDVLQGLDINPDDMVQCEGQLYDNRNYTGTN